MDNPFFILLSFLKKPQPKVEQNTSQEAKEKKQDFKYTKHWSCRMNCSTPAWKDSFTTVFSYSIPVT